MGYGVWFLFRNNITFFEKNAPPKLFLTQSELREDMVNWFQKLQVRVPPSIKNGKKKPTAMRCQ